MRRTVWMVLMLLSGYAHAQDLLGGLVGAWAVGSPTACTRSPYELTVDTSGGGPTLTFRDRLGRVNSERVEMQRPDGFTTTTVLSPDVTAGTRWDYTITSTGAYLVRNLSNGRQFTLLRCAAAAVQSTAAPTFTDPVALVTWLIQHSNGHGFGGADDIASTSVFSPGLRAGLRASFARSVQLNEPPCGADGDIILDCQECGPVQNLRISPQPTAPDRTTVAVSYDIVGYHRSPKFMVVLLDGLWKVENIVYSNGSSLRRSLDCRR